MSSGRSMRSTTPAVPTFTLLRAVTSISPVYATKTVLFEYTLTLRRMHPMAPTHTASILMTLAACAMLGFRHGFDYDHIAAIGDISTMQDRPWRAMRLSLMYALG